MAGTWTGSAIAGGVVELPLSATTVSPVD